MNFILTSITLTFLVAQFINIALRTKKQGRFTLQNVFMDGGMPSRHASIVTALTYSVGLVEGFNSTPFFISLVFSLLVLRDAIGVRHNVDTLAGVLNKHVKKQERIHVISGHTKRQVLAGVLLGLFIVTLLYYL